jgi:hypothetical protein
MEAAGTVHSSPARRLAPSLVLIACAAALASAVGPALVEPEQPRPVMRDRFRWSVGASLREASLWHREVIERGFFSQDEWKRVCEQAKDHTAGPLARRLLERVDRRREELEGLPGGPEAAVRLALFAGDHQRVAWWLEWLRTDGPLAPFHRARLGLLLEEWGEGRLADKCYQRTEREMLRLGQDAAAPTPYTGSVALYLIRAVERARLRGDLSRGEELRAWMDRLCPAMEEVAEVDAWLAAEHRSRGNEAAALAALERCRRSWVSPVTGLERASYARVDRLIAGATGLLAAVLGALVAVVIARRRHALHALGHRFDGDSPPAGHPWWASLSGALPIDRGEGVLLLGSLAAAGVLVSGIAAWVVSVGREASLPPSIIRPGSPEARIVLDGLSDGRDTDVIRAFGLLIEPVPGRGAREAARDATRAAELLERVVKDPGSLTSGALAAIWNDLAVARVEQGQASEAAAALNTALVLDASSRAASLNRRLMPLARARDGVRSETVAAGLLASWSGLALTSPGAEVYRRACDLDPGAVATIRALASVAGTSVGYIERALAVTGALLLVVALALLARIAWPARPRIECSLCGAPLCVSCAKITESHLFCPPCTRALASGDEEFLLSRKPAARGGRSMSWGSLLVPGAWQFVRGRPALGLMTMAAAVAAAIPAGFLLGTGGRVAGWIEYWVGHPMSGIMSLPPPLAVRSGLVLEGLIAGALTLVAICTVMTAMELRRSAGGGR